MKFSIIRFRVYSFHFGQQDLVRDFLMKKGWFSTKTIEYNKSRNLSFKIFLNKNPEQAKKIAHKETQDFPNPQKPFYFKEGTMTSFLLKILFFQQKCAYCCHPFVNSKIKECPYCRQPHQ